MEDPPPEPEPIQIAIADEDEAKLADAAAAFEEDLANLPPAPEEPPDEWMTVARLPAASALQSPSAVAQPPAPAGNNGHGDPPGSGTLAETKPEYRSAPQSNVGMGDAVAYAGTGRRESPRHLRIYLERAGDYDEEVRRMREVLDVLRSASGRDRFTFFVPNPQGIVQLDFPNFTTSFSIVEDRLNELVNAYGTLEVQ